MRRCAASRSASSARSSASRVRGFRVARRRARGGARRGLRPARARGRRQRTPFASSSPSRPSALRARHRIRERAGRLAPRAEQLEQRLLARRPAAARRAAGSRAARGDRARASSRRRGRARARRPRPAARAPPAPRSPGVGAPKTRYSQRPSSSFTTGFASAPGGWPDPLWSWTQIAVAELEPLGAVDRHHLDRVLRRQLGARVGAGAAPRPARPQPAQQRLHVRLLGLQIRAQLAEEAVEVGEPEGAREARGLGRVEQREPAQLLDEEIDRRRSRSSRAGARCRRPRRRGSAPSRRCARGPGIPSGSSARGRLDLAQGLRERRGRGPRERRDAPREARASRAGSARRPGRRPTASAAR